MSKYIAYPKNLAPSISNNLWTLLREDAFPTDLSLHGPVIVSYAYWKNHQKELQEKSANQALGVFFSVTDDVLHDQAIIQEGMPHWGLIAVDFPIFRDGRGFSTATILREQYYWEKELRAIGDVLIDQLVQMARVGFDAFELREDQQLDVAIAQLQRFPVKMQNDWRGARTLLQGVV